MFSIAWTSGLLLLLCLATTCQSFSPPSNLQKACSRKKSTSLQGGLFGLGKKENENEESPSQSNDASIPTRVLDIPVASLKKGGLRFTLGLHLIGQQDNGMWKANQASDTVLDMYYKDNSAMFSVVLEDDAIRVERYGKPSLAYVLQESIVLHTVLDELNTLAFEGDIEVQNRLLQLSSDDAIGEARSSLPARKA